MNRGTVVVNEIVIAVLDLQFVAGKLMIYGSVPGPRPGFEGGVTDMEFFGTDGSACGSVRVECPAWPATNDVSYLHLELPIQFTEINGAAGTDAGD